jgi:hypothetical protein
LLTEEIDMMLRRAWRTGAALVLVSAAFLPSCSRRKPVEINDITPSVKINRVRAPLGSYLELTFTWTVGPNAKKLTTDYNAFVHFLDSHQVMLFADSHPPTPPTTTWESGKSYSYTRTIFVPVYPYVGPVEVRIGLFKERERLGLKGEDKGMLEYKVASMELLPQTENIFLVYKDGWHSPESSAANPSQERTWTKQEALASFKNPKKDVVVYLEADTNFKAFAQPPVLTVAVGSKAGITLPIENSEVFMKRIRVKAADLGTGEWVDLRLSMNQSFVPKQLTPPINNDSRELGLLVYHLYVGEADRIGELPASQSVDAGPLPQASPAPKGAAKGATTKSAPTAKPTPAPAKPKKP